MSTRIMAQCWGLPLHGVPKSVLISLADQANDDGVCWPSVGSICERTGWSERTVRQAIGELERMGVLTLERQSGKSTTYCLTPAGYAGVQEVQGCTTRRTPLQELQDTPAGAAGPYTLNLHGSVTDPSLGAKRTRKPTKRRRQLPDDFDLTDERRDYCERTAPTADPESEFAQFADHHRARATRMLDWDAAWRTWVRNAEKFNRGSGHAKGFDSGAGSARKPSLVERVRIANGLDPEDGEVRAADDAAVRAPLDECTRRDAHGIVVQGDFKIVG